MIIGEWPSTPLMDLALTAVIGAEDKQLRGMEDPSLARNTGNDLPSDVQIFDDDDISLLHIAFRWRR